MRTCREAVDSDASSSVGNALPTVQGRSIFGPGGTAWESQQLGSVTSSGHTSSGSGGTLATGSSSGPAQPPQTRQLPKMVAVKGITCRSQQKRTTTRECDGHDRAGLHG